VSSLNWSTRHGEKSVFEALTETIVRWKASIKALLDDYRVIWETVDRNYDSTSYAITGFGTSVGETTLKIRGGRGGEYEISPNRALPLDRLLSPQAGWKEELTKLAILSPDFEYVEKNSWRGFLSEYSRYCRKFAHRWNLILRIRLFFYCCSQLGLGRPWKCVRCSPVVHLQLSRDNTARGVRRGESRSSEPSCTRERRSADP